MGNLRRQFKTLGGIITVRSHFVTFLTASLPVLSWIEVVWNECVTSFAVRFTGINPRRAFASQHIFPMGNGFNMDGIYTGRSLTEMVTLQTPMNGGDEYAVNDKMGSPLLESYGEQSIPPVVLVSDPLPTRNALVKVFSTYLDFGKNAGEKFAIDNARIDCSHDISFTDVVVRLGSVLSAPFRAVSMLPHPLASEV